MLQLLLGFHPSAHFADEVIEVGRAQLLFILIAPGRTADESDGEIAQPHDKQPRQQQQVVDDDQRDCKKLEPKVRIAVEQGFGNELGYHQNDQRRNQCLHCQHQNWLCGFRPVAHAEKPVANERPGFQSAKHQSEVVANEHGGNEELGARR